MPTNRYQVEFKSDDPVDWIIDHTFDSLDEALAYATEHALRFKTLKHRVCRTAVVMNFPAMEEHQ